MEFEVGPPSGEGRAGQEWLRRAHEALAGFKGNDTQNPSWALAQWSQGAGGKQEAWCLSSLVVGALWVAVEPVLPFAHLLAGGGGGTALAPGFSALGTCPQCVLLLPPCCPVFPREAFRTTLVQG